MKVYLAILIVIVILSSGCTNNGDSLNEENENSLPESVNNKGQKTGDKNEDCEEPVFTHYFVDPEKVKVVQPLGVVHGSGSIIVGRSYVFIKDEYDGKIPVYAPADAVLIFGSYYTGGSTPGENTLPDYAITFDIGCGYSFSFCHLKEMIPEIAKRMPELSSSNAGVQVERYEVKAGDLIGYFIPNTGVSAFDFIVENNRITNQFANQERYEFKGSNLLHTICPYDLYRGEMKEAYYDLFGDAFGERTGVMDCGTVERDIEGTISGMWFLDKVPVRGVHDTVREGDYGSPLPIADDGGRIVIGRIDETNIWINHDNPTYKDPAEVKDEHCYQILPPSQGQGYIYFKIISDMEMRVFYSDIGTCPESFPAEGWKSYYR